MITKTFPLGTLAALAALAFTACSDQTTPATDMASLPEIPIAEVKTLDTVIYSEYVASIQATKNVEIRSRLSGFLEKIYVDEGSTVTKGQPLFKLNDVELKSEVARSEAVLENAIAEGKTTELEVSRTRLLVDQNIVSETDLEVAIAKLNAAQANIKEAQSMLEHANRRLSYATIRAPFDGQIDRIPMKEGSLLDEGTLLTSISDLNEIFAYFDISEQEYLGIVGKHNQRKWDFSTSATLTLADGTTYPYEGTAEFAENEFKATTGTISLRARFPNPDRLIKHGASGKVNVPMQQGAILVVHQKSVFEIQDRTYVYRVNDDNTVTMTPFQAGPRIGHYYLVQDGLKAEDRIVFEGVQNLRDGMAIEPLVKDAEKPQLLSSNY